MIFTVLATAVTTKCFWLAFYFIINYWLAFHGMYQQNLWLKTIEGNQSLSYFGYAESVLDTIPVKGAQ